jgi:hypothetical protein
VQKYCHGSGKPASAKKAWASAVLTVSSAAPMAATIVSQERAPDRRRACLTLANACSMGLKSGEEVGKKTRWQPAATMRRRAGALSWTLRVSWHHDLPGAQAGDQEAFDDQVEDLAVDRAGDDHARPDALRRQGGQPGEVGALAARDVADGALPPRDARAQRRQAERGAGLVQEDEAGRIDPGDAGAPGRAH